MKKTIFFCSFLLLFCGCVRQAEHFRTLSDYEQNFDRTQKISLAGKKSLSLSEAQKIALANNPTLRSAASAVKSAQYSYYRSLSAWSPEITASWENRNTNARGYDLHHPPAGIFPEENVFSNAVSVRATWLLFNGLAREMDILVSRAEYDRSISVSNDVRRLLIRAVIYTWCDILLAAEEIIIARADKAFQEAALRQAEQQFKAGHVPYSTVLNFKILSGKAQSRIFLARYNRRTALNALFALLGYNNRDFPADMKLQAVTPAKANLHRPLSFYFEQAVLNRPDLKAEKLQFEKALLQKQAAYASFMPEIYLFADFSLESAAAEYGGYSVDRSYYNRPAFSGGISGTWNLFRGLDSLNEVRRREALAHAALWGLNKKYLDVMTEVRDALACCRNAFEQIGIYRSMTGWVQTQRDLIYSEYLNGRETIARVNQAQSELVEVQSSFALWEIQSRKAEAQLAAALGMDSVPE